MKILWHDGYHNTKWIATETVGFHPDTLEPVKYTFKPTPTNRISKDKLRRTEVEDISTNSLFRGVKTVWDIEDCIERFWNRLNPLPTAWRGASIVKVLRVECLCKKCVIRMDNKGRGE